MITLEAQLTLDHTSKDPAITAEEGLLFLSGQWLCLLPNRVGAEEEPEPGCVDADVNSGGVAQQGRRYSSKGADRDEVGVVAMAEVVVLAARADAVIGIGELSFWIVIPTPFAIRSWKKIVTPSESAKKTKKKTK
ncbi:hypothetical protein KSP40_PGU021607 [Platanthera guangdongensis]|uniref:Uncharacterized protein n=1 Tax=Platanthera guangdongensis TaxID=2320717 RepID=A0ABR2M7G8_9ASPA